MTNLKMYKACLITFCEALQPIIEEAKSRKKLSIGKKNENFDTGYLCCLHRIITLIQQQAEIYEISLDDLSLSDLKENDLI